MKRSGTADLPLHGGRVPPWLAQRMTQLGTVIADRSVVSRPCWMGARFSRTDGGARKAPADPQLSLF